MRTSLKGISEEGLGRGLVAQVADVNKALLSVSRLVRSGYKVVFDEEESYIEDRRTGERMLLNDVGGMYGPKLWVEVDF